MYHLTIFGFWAGEELNEEINVHAIWGVLPPSKPSFGVTYSFSRPSPLGGITEWVYGTRE